MSEQAAESRKRGVGFPQLSLRESVEAIITVGQHGANHSQDAAAAYLGHSTANSGAFRSKLASLRDWGLIARGDKDRVRLSELAQSLVLQAPEHEQARDLLLAAFESCRVFGMLFHDSAKDTPLEAQRLRNVVVMRHGVASEQADKFVDSFVESVVYAGLGRFDGTRVTLNQRDTAFASDSGLRGHQEEASGDAATTSQEVVHDSTSVSVTREVAAPTIPVAFRQAWPIDGGEIEFIIRTPDPLPVAIYALMAKMAEVAGEMQDKLTRPEAQITMSPTAPRKPSAAEPGTD